MLQSLGIFTSVETERDWEASLFAGISSGWQVNAAQRSVTASAFPITRGNARHPEDGAAHTVALLVFAASVSALLLLVSPLCSEYQVWGRTHQTAFALKLDVCNLIWKGHVVIAALHGGARSERKVQVGAETSWPFFTPKTSHVEINFKRNYVKGWLPRPWFINLGLCFSTLCISRCLQAVITLSVDV